MGARDPQYYVDGARPSALAEGGSRGEEEGCVPWSADREDVLICESGVPEGWQPAPIPYFDPEVCDSTIRWLDELAARGDDSYPPIIEGSCRVLEDSEGLWTILFKPTSDAEENIHVPFDPEGRTPWAASPDSSA
jgi:hypothetical protein